MHRWLLLRFGRLPEPLQHWLVAQAAPRYALGILVLLRRPDGAVLTLDLPYRPERSLPGGGLKARETVEQAARREVREELGIALPDLLLDPAPDHDPGRRWVTWYAYVELSGELAAAARPCSPEVDALHWVQPEDVPSDAVQVREALTRFVPEVAPSGEGQPARGA